LSGGALRQSEASARRASPPRAVFPQGLSRKSVNIRDGSAANGLTDGSFLPMPIPSMNIISIRTGPLPCRQRVRINLTSGARDVNPGPSSSSSAFLISSWCGAR
jgi:hypothetical protein